METITVYWPKENLTSNTKIDKIVKIAKTIEEPFCKKSRDKYLEIERILMGLGFPETVDIHVDNTMAIKTLIVLFESHNTARWLEEKIKQYNRQGINGIVCGDEIKIDLE